GLAGRVRLLKPSWDDGSPALGELTRLRTSLAGGASLLQAFDALGRAGGPWAGSARRVVGQAASGLRLQEAVDRWARGVEATGVSIEGEVLALLADAVAIAGASGGSQLRAIDAAIATG